MLKAEAGVPIRELRDKAKRAAGLKVSEAAFEPEMVEIALGEYSLIYRVGYTIELQPASAWHRLIVCLKDFPDQLPSPLVVADLMEAFQFTWKLRLPPVLPPIMVPGSYAMIRSARELPLVYRTAEAPSVVNVVEPFIHESPSGVFGRHD
jgi:hypothetical protein